MSSIYHSGERKIQQMAGEEAIAEMNGRIVQSFVPKRAAGFMKRFSFLVLTTLDKKGRVWTSFVTGEPGFISVEDQQTIQVKARWVEGDPLNENLETQSSIGILAIDLAKRLRIRINGQARLQGDCLQVTVEQFYSNCPKYIQIRKHVTADHHRQVFKQQRGQQLSPIQQDWICRADTLFIGTADHDGHADASHRGGNPGFIQVENEQTLLIPDYFGNSMFNTLGNIESNPHTGILLIDFQNGDSLHLTGRAEIIWDEAELSRFIGVERIVRFTIDETIFMKNKTDWTWAFISKSPNNPIVPQHT